jgi:hypothetical protein
MSEMFRMAAAALVLGACGDNRPDPPGFEIVGHSPLGARGMNSALAVAGDTVYVGSRGDVDPIVIVDVADPERPTVVGELGPAVPGISSRELRVVPELDLLLVLSLQCSPDLHGCSPRGETEGLKLYDIADRRAPRLLHLHPITGGPIARRSPHEMFVWRDPADPARVLVLVAAPSPPSQPSLEIVDVGTRAPAVVARWDAIRDGGLPPVGTENIMHSIAASDDGRHGYVSHQHGGLFVIDLGAVVDREEPPEIAMVTPPDQVLHFGAMGPHSAVPVPGRPLLVTTEEVYPPPFGAGCPWGHVRLVDIADPARPMLAGEFLLPENRGDCASAPERTAFTAHNATATRDLAFVTWYAGGLHAIDISDPARPVGVAELRPDPLPSVTAEDPGLGGHLVAMWSYPVIQDGLMYVVDSRNGLYVLRYHGPFSAQVRERGFLEGNSNLR